MKRKPIDMMHLYFGERGECCGTCCNLREWRYNDKKVRKCVAYGGLHSQKADWAKRWTACGLYGKAVAQQMISDTEKQRLARQGNWSEREKRQVDGQIGMEMKEDIDRKENKA